MASGRPLSGAERQTLNDASQGKVYWRGDEAYETARGNTAYRANKPKRFPQVIVQAENDQDVIVAVKFAKTHGLKVTRRSGGHSWSSAHIRDNCLLIDLAKMQEITIDPATSTLWVNPGVIGSVINARLKPYDLIVPTAHHPSPGIGGFCMNGGFGWNSRLWGNGARHVLAIEVVNAEGEKIYADDKQNSDFWWAARGGGSGFFGVVTRMKLQARPMPKVWLATAYGWDDAAAVFDDLMTWACKVVPQVAPNIEMVIISTANHRQTGDPVPTRISLGVLALADTEEEALAGLKFIDSCPVIDKANFKVERQPTTLEERYQSGFRADPAGFRFAADNMYTEATGGEAGSAPTQGLPGTADPAYAHLLVRLGADQAVPVRHGAVNTGGHLRSHLHPLDRSRARQEHGGLAARPFQGTVRLVARRANERREHAGASSAVFYARGLRHARAVQEQARSPGRVRKLPGQSHAGLSPRRQSSPFGADLPQHTGRTSASRARVENKFSGRGNV